MVAEAAPVAPELAGFVVAFGAIAGTMLLLAIILTVRTFVSAFFGGVEHLLSHIPGAGGLVAEAVDWLTQHIVSVLAEAELGLDGALAYWLREVGVLWRLTVHEIRSTEHDLMMLARLVLGSSAVHAVESAVGAIESKVAGAVHTAVRALEHSIATAERYAKTIAQGVYPRLRSLEHEVGRVIPREIKSTRHLAREAEQEAARAWSVVKAHPWTVATDAFAAAVAVALSRLGLGWVRCSNVGRFGRSVCGMPGNLLNDLLGLFADFFILTNVCELIPILETVASDVGTPLVEGLTYVGAGLCGGGAGAESPLVVPALELPAVYFTGELILP